MNGHRPAIYGDRLTNAGVAPGTAAIEYERVVLNRSIESENVFAGKRTKAMDEAWAELIKRTYTYCKSHTLVCCLPSSTAMALKISKEELNRLGETSISFRDGSGYLAEMAVFHELHCVVHIPFLLFDRIYNNEAHMVPETPSQPFDYGFPEHDGSRVGF